VRRKRDSAGTADKIKAGIKDIAKGDDPLSAKTTYNIINVSEVSLCRTNILTYLARLI
jgi:hypothetical protein